MIPLTVPSAYNSRKFIKKRTRIAKKYLERHDRLHRFRCFLTRSKTSRINMDSEQLKIIETDFKDMKKSDSTLTAVDYDLLLVLARLYAITNDDESIHEESWEWAKAINQRRLMRIADTTLPPPNAVKAFLRI